MDTSDKLLKNEHADDIGIFKEDYQLLMNSIIPKIQTNGFQIIQKSADIISILRDNLYIDICIFKKRKNIKTEYRNKLYKEEFYLKLDHIFLKEKDSMFQITLKNI